MEEHFTSQEPDQKIGPTSREPDSDTTPDSTQSRSTGTPGSTSQDPSPASQESQSSCTSSQNSDSTPNSASKHQYRTRSGGRRAAVPLTRGGARKRPGRQQGMTATQGDETADNKMQKIEACNEGTSPDKTEEMVVVEALEERPSETDGSKMDVQEDRTSVSEVENMIVQEDGTCQSKVKETQENDPSLTEVVKEASSLSMMEQSVEELHEDKSSDMEAVVDQAKIEALNDQSSQDCSSAEVEKPSESCTPSSDPIENGKDTDNERECSNQGQMEEEHKTVIDDNLIAGSNMVDQQEVKIGDGSVSERSPDPVIPTSGVQEVGVVSNHVLSLPMTVTCESDPGNSTHFHSDHTYLHSASVNPSAVQDVIAVDALRVEAIELAVDQPLIQDIVTFEGTPPEVIVMSTVSDLLVRKQSSGDEPRPNNVEERKEQAMKKELENGTVGDQDVTMDDQDVTMADQAVTMVNKAETMVAQGPSSKELPGEVSTNVDTVSSNNGRHSDSDAGRQGNTSIDTSSTDATTSNSCHDDSDGSNKGDSSNAPSTHPPTARVVVADKIKTRRELSM